MAAIAKGVKERGKNVFAFTGFTYEELVKKAQSGDGTQELLDLCDYIVDGRFVLAERDLSLRFRGSRNQRIRRITGYLVGDMSHWNNAKRAEEGDRVKHDCCC